MAIFCTISTKSHLFKAYALADSIAKFGGELKILLIDSSNPVVDKNLPTNVEIYFLKSLKSNRAKQTIRKYKNDKLRWALKPIFLIHLLSDYSEVIYIDNDIYFINDYNFLFEELKNIDVILTPHFYPANPTIDQTWLEANHRIGLYNAGFIGANVNAIEALKWWSDCCLYEIKKSYWRGLFDDQKYLDLLPILFNNVKIIKNRGCNFAGWNSNSNIELEHIVFIHFNSFTLKVFKEKTNKYYSLFNHYNNQLKKYHPNYKESSKRLRLFNIQNGVYFIKWKLARLINY